MSTNQPFEELGEHSIEEIAGAEGLRSSLLTVKEQGSQ